MSRIHGWLTALWFSFSRPGSISSIKLYTSISGFWSPYITQLTNPWEGQQAPRVVKRLLGSSGIDGEGIGCSVRVRRQAQDSQPVFCPFQLAIYCFPRLHKPELHLFSTDFQKPSLEAILKGTTVTERVPTLLFFWFLRVSVLTIQNAL